MGETFRYFILAAPVPTVVSVIGDGATTDTGDPPSPHYYYMNPS